MITEGFLARHHMGRAGMAAPALLDVAQDYALHYLHQQGIFDFGIVLKGGTAFDEPLTRRLLVLKVWHDNVDDGLGTAPFEPAEMLADLDTQRMPSEDIGLLTQPVDPQRWLNRMTERYSFITAVDGTEERLAACSARERGLASQAVAELAASRTAL